MRWLESQHPDIAVVTFASAGGMRTSIATAVEMNHMGYKKGTPDVMILFPTQRYHGLIIEIKTEQGRASPEQVAILQRLQEKGYLAVVAKGWEMLVKTVKSYIG